MHEKIVHSEDINARIIAEYFSNCEIDENTLQAINEKKGSVLDVGCGNGVFVKYIQDKYPNINVWGVEPMADSYELLTDKILRFTVGSDRGPKLFRETEWDLIVCKDSIPKYYEYSSSGDTAHYDYSLQVGRKPEKYTPADFQAFDATVRRGQQVIAQLASSLGVNGRLIMAPLPMMERDSYAQLLASGKVMMSQCTQIILGNQKLPDISHVLAKIKKRIFARVHLIHDPIMSAKTAAEMGPHMGSYRAVITRVG